MVDKIKLWIFPSIVTVLSMMIWHDVRTIQEDVKLLMAQSNVDKTRIDNLENRVNRLESATYNVSKKTQSKYPEQKMHSVLFIREEEYDYKKYLRKKL